MRKFGEILIRSALGLGALCWSCAAFACNVPVFRYALERWEPDAYQVVVFHSQPLTTEQASQVAVLEKAALEGTANLKVDRVDVTREVPTSLRDLWAGQTNATSPWLVVRYPRLAGIERPAWAGVLSAEAVSALLGSPVRRDMVQRILGGDSVVWLVLESGDKRRDDEVSERLEAELGKLEKTLVLPERSPSDPAINPDLPLKIAFSVVRLARSDPAERMLVNLLLSWSTNLMAATEPMLFPIFGRGRVVPPAVGSEIRAEAIKEMAEFLTGPCSCEVKEMNPGYDLLLTANWGAVSGYQEEPVPTDALVGMSQFAAKAATNAPASPPERTVPIAAAAGSVPAPAGTNLMARNLIIVAGLGAVFLGAMTFVLKARSGRRPR